MRREPRRCSCSGCDKSLEGRRADAQYCSAACRARACRQRLAPPSSAGSDAEQGAVSNGMAAPTFVEVHLAGMEADEPAGLLPSASPDIELLLVSGHRLKIPKDFDAPTLRRLVLTLETLPC